MKEKILNRINVLEKGLKNEETLYEQTGNINHMKRANNIRARLGEAKFINKNIK